MHQAAVVLLGTAVESATTVKNCNAAVCYTYAHYIVEQRVFAAMLERCRVSTMVDTAA
jgi:hypothetical protein